jgi:hypothetical protein
MYFILGIIIIPYIIISSQIFTNRGASGSSCQFGIVRPRMNKASGGNILVLWSQTVARFLRLRTFCVFTSGNRQKDRLYNVLYIACYFLYLTDTLNEPLLHLIHYVQMSYCLHAWYIITSWYDYSHVTCINLYSYVWYFVHQCWSFYPF